jgi:Siphovirus Gp157
MTVLTAIKTAAPVTTEAPSPGLWQLGIENQELTSRVARLAEQLDSDDPELRSEAIGELEAALLQEEGHRQALDSKADSYCWVIEHLRAQAAYRQQQAKRLVELARGEESRADALEESLVLVLTRLQPAATRFSFPHHELTSRKSQAVEIDDEDSLPPEWLTHKTTSQPDKPAIKEALKAGHPIPGAQLISRRSWRIR